MGRDTHFTGVKPHHKVQRAKPRHHGPIGLAILKVRAFFANWLSLHAMRLAHRRAAPVRLSIGVLIGVVWLWLGGAAAFDLARGDRPQPAAHQQTTQQPTKTLSPFDDTIKAIGNGLCLFREGTRCQYEGDDPRIFLGQMALTSLAFVTLFFGFWRSLFDAFAKAFRAIGARHVIITGEGAEAEALSRAVVRKGKHRRAVVLIKRNASSAEVESMGADGINLMVGDPTSVAVIKAAGAANAYRVVALGSSDAENLATAAAVRKLRKGYAPGDVAVRLESHALRRDLPSRSGIGATDLFSLPEIAARLLTQSELLLEDVDARDGASGVHVAIIGWDEHALAVAERVLRMMWAPGFHPPRVTVFAADPKDAQAAFAARFPNAFDDPGAPGKSVWVADIKFLEFHWRGLSNPWSALAQAEAERGLITSVVLTFPTDQETLHCAAVMAGRANISFPRMYVRDDRDGTIGAVLSDYDHVAPFAEYAAAISPRALVDRTLDHAARKIHELYIAGRVLDQNQDDYIKALRKGYTIPQRVRRTVHWPLADASLQDLESDFQETFGVPAFNKMRTHLTEKLLNQGRFEPKTAAQCLWHDLKEHYIQTNRVAADHALLKVRSLGWTPAPQKGGGRLPAVKNEHVTDDAAEIEHLRWCADKLLSGWRYGPVRDEDELIHPDLKPYTAFDPEKLPEAIQKDREQWIGAPEIASWIYPNLFMPRAANAAAPV
ncbi:MAG: NAD-binding protein [Caulobacterales bacterium]